MTGLECLQLMAAGKIPPPSMGLTMQMRPVTVNADLIEFEATAGDQHLNPAGAVHGGFAATVLDTVTGCIVMCQLEDAAIPYATLDLSIKMLRPIPRNERLLAKGKLINLSKRTAVSEGHLYSADNKLLAHATAVCIIQRKNA